MILHNGLKTRLSYKWRFLSFLQKNGVKIIGRMRKYAYLIARISIFQVYFAFHRDRANQTVNVNLIDTHTVLLDQIHKKPFCYINLE